MRKAIHTANSAATPAVISALALMLASAGLPATAQPNISAERGGEIAERWCVECHATGGAKAADVGPPFPDIARRQSPDYLRGFLTNPHLRGLMPPFDLSRQQIDDIIAYMQTLK